MVAGIKLKQEEVIQRFKDKHGDKYEYKFVEYVNAKTKVKIICPVHGEFLQEAAAHMQGKGCRKCQAIKTGNRCRSTFEDFVTKSTETHGDLYDYSEVLYTDSHTKVNIICKTHGGFFQKPTHHVDGIGCPKCGKDSAASKLKRTDEEFISKARAVHGDRYDYSEMNYKNSNFKITVKCREHGTWKTSPVNHLVGSGCPTCGGSRGFSAEEDGIFYIIQSPDDITKVGISNRAAENRLKNVSSSYGKPFRKIKHYYGGGAAILNLEKEIIKLLRKEYKQPNFVFDGYTECFYDVNLPWLLNTVESKLKEINEKEIKK